MCYTATDTILYDIVPFVVSSEDRGMFFTFVGILCKSQPLSGKWIVCLQDYILASIQAMHSTSVTLALGFCDSKIALNTFVRTFAFMIIVRSYSSGEIIALSIYNLI